MKELGDRSLGDQVWWFNPHEVEESTGYHIKPWAVCEEEAGPREYTAAQGSLSQKIISAEEPFLEDDLFEGFYIGFEKSRRRKAFDPDDFSGIGSGGIMLTKALRDMVSEFDLGRTQVIERPMHDCKRIDPRVPFTRPDRHTRLPGQYFLLHVLDRKDSFNLEASHGLHVSKQRFSKPSPNAPYQKDLSVAVDRSALIGADLWREENFNQRYLFISDRLKTAIENSGLRVKHLKFHKCHVIDESKRL